MNKNKLLNLMLTILIAFLTVQITVNGKETDDSFPTINNCQKGYRYNIQGWTYIYLEGEPYERGYQYGYLAPAEIVNMFIRWANTGQDIDFTRNPPKDYDDLSRAWWETCKEKSMKYFEKYIPEEYKQEMKGMADGLNDRGAKMFDKYFEYEDIVTSQFIQDVWYAFYYDYSYRKFHPIRTLIYGIRDLFIGNKDYGNLGHCNAFIATGDATEDGEIVIAHATQFQLSIAERVNFIVDIKPTTGYRFQMAAPPGCIWSQEDFYQNEKGIVITESELVPQGPFTLRKTPKGVRSRNAIQYSSNIDEVIYNLQKDNNGLIPNEWLIGDTKTGEIARLEQAYFHTPVTRKTNGFFFSCKAPNSDEVERELWGFRTKRIMQSYNFPNKYDNPVIDKFNELEEKYHGKINAEIAITIMTTDPLSQASDCKITSSKLLNDMGMVIFFGRLNETVFYPIDEKFKKFNEITVLPPSGWVEIFDSNFKNIEVKPTNFNDEKSKVLWEIENNGQGDINYSSFALSDGFLFNVDSQGNVNSFDIKEQKTSWSKKLNEKIFEIKASDKLLFVSTDLGLTVFDKITGQTKWEKNLGKVISEPILYKNIVVASFSNGKIYGFEVDSGKISWSYYFKNTAYISNCKENMISICAGNICYGFDLENQKTLWEYETDKIITASARMVDSTVYFGSWDGNLYVLDKKTGELKWKYQTGWGIDSTPEVKDGLVYIGGLDNNFYAIDKKSGELEWFFTCKSAIHSNPLCYGDYVFFGCDDGRFYALDKITGDLAWSFSPGYSLDETEVNNYITTPILSSPYAEEGVIYFSAKGTIYALDAQTTEESKEIINKNNDITLIAIFILLFLLGAVILIRTYLINKKNN